MSLLDGLLRDALLETVMQQDVYLANRTDSSPGSGTELNPYQAAGTATDIDPPFDQIMRKLAAEPGPRTVRLLPGTYYTKGYNLGSANPDHSTTPRGWRPKSGLRIVGSGISNTTLKLTNSASGNGFRTSVIGHNVLDGDHFLEGFEISDLMVDCNGSMAAANASVAGVSLNGRNMYFTRLLIKAFTADGTGPESWGLHAAAAWHTDVPALTLIPENNVIDTCQILSPAGTNTNGVVGVRFSSEAQGYFHKFCVIRNTLIDLSTNLSSNYACLALSGCLGTIVEHNRLVNAKTGLVFPLHDSPSVVYSNQDLILRHSYFNNVVTAVDAQAHVYDQERLIFLNNVVEWAKAADSSSVMGVKLSSIGGDYKVLILRDNVMRRREAEVPNGNETGIDLTAAVYDEAVVDNNLMDVGNLDKGLRHPNTGTIKVFNNLKSDGTLLRGYNTGTGLRDQELTTEVEDVLLGI